ncbi:MAG: ABC transporter ATP-binding protein [Caldilineaceae bacterium]
MLQLTDIEKTYQHKPVLTGIHLTVAAGEIVCLLGPSGCGKTTLLRIVAGLEKADNGLVTFAGQDLAQTPVHQRNFGLMFQDFALFPHKSVGENIAFGLRMEGQPKGQIAKRVEEMLALVNLQGYENRSIFALSGGERQRVALARSLAPNPRLLMLDEPLGSLDRTLREELMNELRAILKRVGMTSLYVTHDQQEAFAVADRVVVMNKGRIEQIGAPTAVYEQPANAFVAGFLGFKNLLPARVEPGQVQTPLGEFTLPGAPPPGEYRLLIRPQAATLYETPPVVTRGPMFQGKLLACSFRGNYYQIQIEAQGVSAPYGLTFEIPVHGEIKAENLVSGELFYIMLNPALLNLLPTSQ